MLKAHPIPWSSASHCADQSGFEMIFAHFAPPKYLSTYLSTYLEQSQHLPATCSPWLMVPLGKQHPKTAGWGRPQALVHPGPICASFLRGPRQPKSREQLALKATFFQRASLSFQSANINSSSCNEAMPQEPCHHRQPLSAKPLPTAANLLPSLAGSAAGREANAN